MDYKLFEIVTTAIIIRDVKYLITQRSMTKKRFPGMWTVPGGHLETEDYEALPKDTENYWYNVLEQVLKREVKEEVGLDIKNIKYLTSLAFEREDGIPTLIVSLYADNDGDEIVLSDELSDYKWVNLEEAKSYDLIEGIYEELEMLDRVLKGEERIEWSKLD